MATGRRGDRGQFHGASSGEAARTRPVAPLTAAEAERRIEEIRECAGDGQSPPRPDAAP